VRLKYFETFSLAFEPRLFMKMWL